MGPGYFGAAGVPFRTRRNLNTHPWGHTKSGPDLDVSAGRRWTERERAQKVSCEPDRRAVGARYRREASRDIGRGRVRRSCSCGCLRRREKADRTTRRRSGLAGELDTRHPVQYPRSAVNRSALQAPTGLRGRSRRPERMPVRGGGRRRRKDTRLRSPHRCHPMGRNSHPGKHTRVIHFYPDLPGDLLSARVVG